MSKLATKTKTSQSVGLALGTIAVLGLLVFFGNLAYKGMMALAPATYPAFPRYCVKDVDGYGLRLIYNFNRNNLDINNDGQVTEIDYNYVRDASIDIYGPTTLIDNISHNYISIIAPESNYSYLSKKNVCADVNLNGKIDASDVQLVSNGVARLTPATGNPALYFWYHFNVNTTTSTIRFLSQNAIGGTSYTGEQINIEYTNFNNSNSRQVMIGYQGLDQQASNLDLSLYSNYEALAKRQFPTLLTKKRYLKTAGVQKPYILRQRISALPNENQKFLLTEEIIWLTNKQDNKWVYVNVIRSEIRDTSTIPSGGLIAMENILLEGLIPKYLQIYPNILHD